MSGIFQTFNVAKRGMQAQQNAINTASHNISNANTDGFSRQRVNLQTTEPYTYVGIGQIGTGVEVVSITRTRDEFLDAQIQTENAIDGRFQSMEAVLEQVEMIFMEPSDTGLNTLLNEFWISWQELSKSPENSNAKTIVAQSADTLSRAVNHMDGQMESLVSDTAELQEAKVYDANMLLGQINDLNEQIYKVKIKGMEPNDLMDRRSLLVDQLSGIIDIKTETDGFGSMKIINRETGSILLDANPQALPEVEMSVVHAVASDGAGGFDLTIALKGDFTKLVTVNIADSGFKQGDVIFAAPDAWSGSPVTLEKPELEEGALAGNRLAMDSVESYRDQLDALINGIAQSVNEIHGAVDGTAFFETADGGAVFSAANLSVSEAIIKNPGLIEAARDADSPAGDGSRALAIAQLRNGRFDMSDIETDIAGYIDADMAIPSNASGTSFDSFFKDIVAKIGINSQEAQRGADNQEALLLQLVQRRESISGVSLDEEVANLIQFQTAYQANAKVLSTLTLMLDTLINGLGL